MQVILLLIFFICFAFLCFTRFNLALFFLFLLFPTYLIDFNLGPIPTNMVEVMLGFVVLGWLAKKGNKAVLETKTLLREKIYLTTGIFFFILGATISVFNGIDPISALGEWKSFYIEPIILTLILTTSIKNKQELKNILFALLISVFATSSLAVYQHFTGAWVPYSFWNNNNAYRATAWYGFPNAVGHFLAPTIPVAIYLIYDAFKPKTGGYLSKIKAKLKWMWNKITGNELSKQRTRGSLKKILMPAVSLLSVPLIIWGIFSAKSTGALIGFVGGLGILLLFFKQIRWWAITMVVIGLIAIFMLPSENTIKQELLLKNRTGQLRIDMYKQTFEFISDNPIFSAGIGAYRDKIIPYRDNPNIEVFHHPHNLWLTIWVNLGVIGFIGFILILIWFYYFVVLRENYDTINTQQELKLLATSVLTTYLVMGLVDSPYIKNDLALLFWLPIAIALLSERIK